MLRQLLRPAIQNVNKRSLSGYHAPAGYKRATLDDCPIPQGSWQQAYDAMQRKYNMQLAAGVAFFLGTIAYIGATGAIYFNWGPPVPKNK